MNTTDTLMTALRRAAKYIRATTINGAENVANIQKMTPQEKDDLIATWLRENETLTEIESALDRAAMPAPDTADLRAQLNRATDGILRQDWERARQELEKAIYMVEGLAKRSNEYPMSQEEFVANEGAYCPYCGSGDLEGGEYVFSGSYRRVHCRDCGKDYLEILKTVGYRASLTGKD